MPIREPLAEGLYCPGFKTDGSSIVRKKWRTVVKNVSERSDATVKGMQSSLPCRLGHELVIKYLDIRRPCLLPDSNAVDPSSLWAERTPKLDDPGAPVA